MNQPAIFPFFEDIDHLERYCKLPLHSGIGTITRQGAASAGEPFAASFLVPADRNCLIFFRWPSWCPLSRNFWHGLTVSGESPNGPFRLECPQFYVRATSDALEELGWAVAAPINQIATVSYGDSRPIAKVTATINNFDFERGNVTGVQRPTLRVEASGRTVEFTWRKDRNHLRRLADSRIVSSTALVTFSFTAWPGATDIELTTLAHHVASFCSYVVGQHTGIPVLSFFDAEGRVVRRILGEAIQSNFRRWCALPDLDGDWGLPKLFRQCFEEHVRMQGSALWRRLPYLYAAIEDPPFLEQKYATLMMAVELLIRNSLVDSGQFTLGEAESKTLPELIGAARRKLLWDVPKHYTEEERYRLVRNAVDHGNRLPHTPTQVRHDFDKWRLFLTRRVLLRLGFDGNVESAQRGFSSSSPVDDFSEGQNSFRP